MTTTHRLGTVTRLDGGLLLTYERRLAHAPARVWAALTESDDLRHWFPTDIVGPRRAGADLTFPFWPEHLAAFGIEEEQDSAPGTVLAWDPPRRFEFNWDDEHLRFDLEEEGGDTILRLTVRIGDPLAHGMDGSPDEATGSASAAAGYHTCLDALADHLDGNEYDPLHEAETSALQKDYLAVVHAQT